MPKTAPVDVNIFQATTYVTMQPVLDAQAPILASQYVMYTQLDRAM